MTMKKLYIHIGTHKTGTTSIQNRLNEYKYSLLKNDAFYISTTGIFKKIPRLTSYDKNLVLKARNELITHMQKFTEISTFITSSEHLSGDCYTGYKNSMLMSQMLFDIVSKLNVKAYIVIYIRRQDRFIESLYGHMIESGLPVPEFKKFINFNEEHYNWNLLVKSYEKKFNKKRIIVRSFDDTLKDGGVLKDFCNCINIPIIPDIKLNSGSPLGSIELQRICNLNLEKKDSDKFSKIIRHRNTMPGAIKLNKKYYFDNNDRELFLKKYQQSNNYIISSYNLPPFPNVTMDKKTSVVDMQDVFMAMINTITQTKKCRTKYTSRKTTLLYIKIKKAFHLASYRIQNLRKK